MTAGRVALVMRSLDGGGMQRCMLDLAGGFVARRLRVDLLVADASGPMRQRLPEGVVLHSLPAVSAARARAFALRRFGADALPLAGVTLPRMLRHLEGLAASLSELRPQAVLAMGTQSNLAAVWARALARVPSRVAVTECSTLSIAAQRPLWSFRRAYPGLVRGVYPRADKVLTVSHAVADDLAATAQLPRDWLETIPNWIGDDLPAKAAAAPPHPWLAPGEPPVVLGVGRLHWQKDFPLLLRAFARLRRQRPLRLILLGEGGERGRLEALARELGIADDLAMPGFVANPYAWMAHAALLTVTSVSEGFGNVIVEALACGLPVVSVDCPGGPREILEGGRFGRLAPVGDADALAEAMAATLDRPPPPELLCARAADFGFERAVERYLALLMKGPRHGA